MSDNVLIAMIGAVGAVLVALIGLIGVLKGGDVLREFRIRKIARLRGKLQHACPHGEYQAEGKQYRVASFFWSPHGTLNYYCRVCNACTSEEGAARSAKWMADNYSDKGLSNWGKRAKKARRLREKLDRLGNWSAENVKDW